MSNHVYSGHGRKKIILAVTLTLLAAGLIAFSQTRAFVWDEGFHLVAASLIAAGKAPYRDFCFPQTPLNAYWNAALMRIFGASWQITHLFAALFVAGAAGLTGEFLLSRLPVTRWKLPCALTAVAFLVFNTVVLEFALVAQAYGICMFLGMAAFRAGVAAAGQKRAGLSLVAGLLAALAAACSLLTAPVVPILLVWTCIYNRSGNRWRKSLAFVCGAVIPFLPVIWLFVIAPRQTMFNIFQYQTMYRRVDWPGATMHDIESLSDWTISTQGLMLGLLALAGLYAVYRKRTPNAEWDRARRAEFYLAAWLAAGLGLFIATAHPTFERYFVVLYPFAVLLAATGLWSVGSKLTRAEDSGHDRPWATAALAITLTALALGRTQLGDLDDTTWKDYREISEKVASVTPPDARLYADEVVYFYLKRTPPSGMEFSYSHKLQLPPGQEALFHVVSEKELAEQIRQGRFATVQLCKDDTIEKYKLSAVFANKLEIQDCSIFWSPKKATAKE